MSIDMLPLLSLCGLNALDYTLFGIMLQPSGLAMLNNTCMHGNKRFTEQ